MKNIIYYLTENAARFPDKAAYHFLSDDIDIENTIYYKDLLDTCKNLAAIFYSKDFVGKRVLLIYKDTLQFIEAFLACQYAGVIPVPVYFPSNKRQFAKVAEIIRDADINTILSSSDMDTSFMKSMFENYDLNQASWLLTDINISEASNSLIEPTQNSTAFIQYTSGTTGNAKGVVISAESLIHNQGLIKSCFKCTDQSKILSWLPFQHDMGLIGNILHTVYVGCTCYIMTPSQFIQKPLRWLTAISKYKISHSGGPNFAYDLCVEKIDSGEIKHLDFSFWLVAYNGAEPVRANTINRFAEKFNSAGFRLGTFYPCYGLAEATLLVSGKRDHEFPRCISINMDFTSEGKLLIRPENSDGKLAISSGRVLEGMNVKIIVPETRKEAGENELGEICINGESVTKGYWNKKGNEIFYEIDNKLFLRTGDMGYLHNDELFVHSRLKEMVIIRGRNYYLNDIEETLRSLDIADEFHSMVAFGYLLEKEEGLVIAVEMKRKVNADETYTATVIDIDNAITSAFGITPFDIIITYPFSIPRTTSGKIRRSKCFDHYNNNAFEILKSKRSLVNSSPVIDRKKDILDELAGNSNYQSVRSYLLCIIDSTTAIIHQPSFSDSVKLTEIGIDSLKSMELVNTINKDLKINISVSSLLQQNTFCELIETIENMLWLKHGQKIEKGITI